MRKLSGEGDPGLDLPNDGLRGVLSNGSSPTLSLERCTPDAVVPGDLR